MPAATRRLLPRALAACLALVAAGCASYQAGTGATPPFASIAVEPVELEARVPQAAALLRRQVTTALLAAGGGVDVTTPDQAEAILDIRLVEARRTRRATRPDDTARGLTYDLELVAELTLRRRDGTVLIDREVIAVSDPALTRGDLPEAEHQLLPVLGERLALRVRSAVLDRW